jgi:acetyl-CoA C-acetyltransferase
VPVVDAAGKVLLDRDETPRATTLEGLGRLEPSFTEVGAAPLLPDVTFDQAALRAYPEAKAVQHVHTAGNSSGLADGAAAVLVASDEYVRAHGLRPRARIRSLATIGSEPVIMLTAPAAASEKALRAAGMTPRDVDLWEINEAFAAVVLQTVKKLGIDMDRVNVNGGAIALGHPLGATGAMLLGTALDELERREARTAVVTMCIGGGQGIAVVLERV